ncbi:MAG: hypothetical protein ACOCUO_03330 [archaeon]
MSTAPTHVVNEDFEPTDNDEAVLGVLKDEQRANPKLLRERTELRKQRINDALRNLRAAGWVRQITRGLYEFVVDPREETDATAGREPPAESEESVDDLRDRLEELKSEAADLRSENEDLRQEVEAARQQDASAEGGVVSDRLVTNIEDALSAALRAQESNHVDQATIDDIVAYLERAKKEIDDE